MKTELTGGSASLTVALLLLWTLTFIFSPLAATAQSTNTPPRAPRSIPNATSGGLIHGVVSGGAIPIPGSRVIASNSSTGRRFIAITDGAGAYSILVPDDGDYSIRATFRGLTTSFQQISVSGGTMDTKPVNFSFDPSASATSNLGASWPAEILPPVAINTISLQPAESVTGGSSGGQFPPFPSDPQFSGDTFTVYGQPSIVNPYFQMADQLRQDFENGHELQAPTMLPSHGRNAETALLPGAIGAPSAGVSTVSHPHGEFFWGGANSALNAEPFVLAGQPAPSPGYRSNGFGGSVAMQPFIPGLTKPSARDFLLLSYQGILATTLVNQYGIVPTDLERQGNFSQLVDSSGQLIPIYPPKSTVPYPNNTINKPLDPAAVNLLRFIPEPNLQAAGGLNYRLLTTQGSHSNNIGASYTHNIGALSGNTPTVGGPSQIVNANFNYGDVANDVVNIFPALGGKSRAQGYALSLGYTFAKSSWTANFDIISSRNNLRVYNPYTNGEDIASTLGIFANPTTTGNAPVNSNAFNYGLPNLVFNNFTGFSETQPNSQLTQIFGVTGTADWVNGSHIVRFGGDIHRIGFDLFGGSNVTGTYIFTGGYTQIEGGSTGNPVATSGSSFADFLLGLPQETTIESPNQKAYARQTNWDLFVRDDWRIRPNFTLCLGLRYDYFSPFVEKFNRLSTLDYNADFSLIAAVQPNQVGPISGAQYPRSLVNPDRNNFSPHAGFAWQAAKNTVVRGGYGINYTVGQYGTFIENLAYQPPFANVQANGNIPHDITTFTLQYGFGNTADIGNYAINRDYRTPYIQNWYFDVQQLLPSDIFLDVGYMGARGSRLDVVSSPGFINNMLPFASAFFDFEDSVAFSNYNALVVRAKKPLRRNLAIQVIYTYSHSIDDASSINAGIPVIAQNWQDIEAEKSNSSFDIRHQVVGSVLYQLPFGVGKAYMNSNNWTSRFFGNWSLMGSLVAATGVPLTPYIAASVAEVERGTHGTLRPNVVAGESITAGGGHLGHWFNTAAFSSEFSEGQQFGNASRYSIPGPGVDCVNLSLSKIVELNETKNLEFRISSTNVFNTVQYAGVDTQLGSSAFGQVTAFQPMRQATFLARFVF